MRRMLMTALGLALVLTVLTGIAYPLVVTGVAQVAFRGQADGSLVTDASGHVVGSLLIGQRFDGPDGQPLARYFQPRPSAAGAAGYDAMASGGSNLGPTNPVLRREVEAAVRQYRAFNHVPSTTRIPIDAVTTSASGLDPEISIANALLQAPRVAAARRLPLPVVVAVIHAATQGRVVGVFGEPGVNVLEANLHLDRLDR
jgi:K+-transporting ATPase ATPase C chain